MKKRLLTGLAMGLFLVGMVGVASAAILSFDDIDLGSSSEAYLSSIGESNYGGFNWDSDWAVGSEDNTDYENAAYSGSQFLSNAYGVDNLSIGGDVLFDFDGAWFATPTHALPADWINISAYDASNNIIGTTGNVSISSTYSWVRAGFANVSYLDIARSDGWFVMDDFTYDEVNPVPEPSTMLLLGSGLVGLVVYRRKRKKV